MTTYDFQFLTQESFPNNKNYEQTLKEFERVYAEQVKLRDKALKQLLDRVFKEIKVVSGKADDKEFVLEKGEGAPLTGGKVVRYVATIQQVFAIPVFEVVYA